MSINKEILPNLERVKDMYNANPTAFIKRYKKKLKLLSKV